MKTLLCIYGMMSLVTLIAYAIDKNAAVCGKKRTSGCEVKWQMAKDIARNQWLNSASRLAGDTLSKCVLRFLKFEGTLADRELGAAMGGV